MGKKERVKKKGRRKRKRKEEKGEKREKEWVKEKVKKHREEMRKAKINSYMRNRFIYIQGQLQLVNKYKKSSQIC